MTDSCSSLWNFDLNLQSWSSLSSVYTLQGNLLNDKTHVPLFINCSVSHETGVKLMNAIDLIILEEYIISWPVHVGFY